VLTQAGYKTYQSKQTVHSFPASLKELQNLLNLNWTDVVDFNPFSGEFIITMSHLPGRVLNIKIPRARPFY